MLPVLGSFGIVVGVLIVAQWGGSFMRRRVPELETEPRAIRFHLAAEGLMALTLVMAGILTLVGNTYGEPLLALGFGMTIYAIVNSAGYFAERREAPPLVMFAVLFVLTVLASGVLVSLGR